MPWFVRADRPPVILHIKKMVEFRMGMEGEDGVRATDSHSVSTFSGGAKINLRKGVRFRRALSRKCDKPFSTNILMTNGDLLQFLRRGRLSLKRDPLFSPGRAEAE